MLTRLLSTARTARAHLSLPAQARSERRRDLSTPLGADPAPDRAVDAALAWIALAQDRSASADGGVARDFSLVTGWNTSYPETTGYIVPTLLAAADRLGRPELEARARRMLDWLVDIQQPDGGFQGGVIGASPVRSVTFNTGQILMGLAAGVARWGDAYRPALQRAGDWLVSIQDPDGCWRKGSTPFAQPGEKVYETHVSWGLFEAARVQQGRGYAEAAMRNVRWALSHQLPNGWFGSCCLEEPDRPLTHTIGYALRGVLEAHRFAPEPALLAAARRTADGALSALRDDGWLPGRLDARWQAGGDWVCLTGSAQIAHCWLMLHEETGEPRYLDAATRALRFVRRTMRLDGPAETRGAVKGSFPVSGGYCRYQYPNWAAKFFLDAQFLERDVRARPAPAPRTAVRA